MKLTFIGQDLPENLTIKVNKKKKTLKQNKTVEFDLDENTNYSILVTSRASLFTKVINLYKIFTHYSTSCQNLCWYEETDCIKLDLSFEYTPQEDETIYLQYRPSFYRLESDAWYPSLINGLEQFECKRKYVKDVWAYWDSLFRYFAVVSGLLLTLGLIFGNNSKVDIDSDITTFETFNGFILLIIMSIIFYFFNIVFVYDYVVVSLRKYYKYYSEKYNTKENGEK